MVPRVYVAAVFTIPANVTRRIFYVGKKRYLSTFAAFHLSSCKF